MPAPKGNDSGLIVDCLKDQLGGTCHDPSLIQLDLLRYITPVIREGLFKWFLLRNNILSRIYL